MEHPIDSAVDWLAAVDERHSAAAFFAVLLAYTAALVVIATGYPPGPRLFPLIVGIPLTVLIAAKIVLLLLKGRFDLEIVGVFSDVDRFDASTSREPVDETKRLRREFSMVLWILLLIVLTFLVGNLVAVAVFVFAFIYVTERNLARAALATVVTSGFIYALFVLVLDAALYRGVLGVGGVIP